MKATRAARAITLPVADRSGDGATVANELLRLQCFTISVRRSCCGSFWWGMTMSIPFVLCWLWSWEGVFGDGGAKDFGAERAGKLESCGDEMDRGFGEQC